MNDGSRTKEKEVPKTEEINRLIVIYSKAISLFYGIGIFMICSFGICYHIVIYVSKAIKNKNA